MNRLEVEAWYATHPEIDDLPVLGPVDINGLPRTGTTALANMLSLDPQFRSLRRVLLAWRGNPDSLAAHSSTVPDPPARPLSRWHWPHRP